ncbi:MAG: SGNH/GDSL hydrolase family protein [Candidatus Choladocola sp.]|nr:SGNH/GDSL hydrolase family protein [Candidatus Choladocola sp.]
MKKGTIIAVVLAASAIAALGILTVFLTFQYKDELFSSGSSTVSEADSVLLSLRETESEKAAEPESDSSESASQGILLIWVGDSRTIGMRDALDNEDVYIGASGEGYSWLSETGLPQLKKAVSEYSEAPVIFNFGVNDPDNLEKYITLYESLTSEYPETHFYFMSVNPIEPTLCDNITNEEISEFNSRLAAAFPDAYIDTFTYMQMSGVVPIDGIHYSEEDYQLIYEYASQEVLRKEEKAA